MRELKHRLFRWLFKDLFGQECYSRWLYTHNLELVKKDLARFGNPIDSVDVDLIKLVDDHFEKYLI